MAALCHTSLAFPSAVSREEEKKGTARPKPDCPQVLSLRDRASCYAGREVGALVVVIVLQTPA